MIDTAGWWQGVDHQPSPHYNERPVGEHIRLLVLHNISLPPDQFGTPYIEQFFAGTLNPNEHPYFESIKDLTVSAHVLIKRCGAVVQFVSFLDRAWHAGLSVYEGIEQCNDYSIGIELEGCDTQAFTPEQYAALNQAIGLLLNTYPKIAHHIVGHSDIAPGRKTDPGPHFDWSQLNYKNYHTS